MDLLFTNGKIGSLDLKNRIIMTAMHTGFSIEDEIYFLTRISRGGAAAVTSVLGVSNTGAYSNMSVISESTVDYLKKMVESIHEVDGKLIIQLFHAGRNATVGMLADSDAYPVAPSSIPSPIYKETPKELSTSDIAEIVEQFARAADICKKSGVDAVEISCSAGYLLSEFISTISNRRADEYGGSLKNRLRFPIEVVRGVRVRVGIDYPILIRVSASDMLGGYGVKETKQLVKSIESEIDAVNVTGGWHESTVPQISMYVPEGGFSFLANEIKNHINVPVIASNRINNEFIAREILELGYSDFVGCARSFLIDCDFANKIKTKIPYKRCIGCNKGCIENVLRMKKATCIFSPDVLDKSTNSIRIQENRLKVLIVGGGPAGLEAALQYAKIGHEVKLCTDQNKIGGQLHVASRAPYKESILDYIDTMKWELGEHGVNICYNTKVNEDYIREYRPDKVVIATGSKPYIPPIKGITRESVFTAEQILLADYKELFKLLNNKVVVIGGGLVGVETALYLRKKTRLHLRSHDFIHTNVDENIRIDLECKSNICILEMTDRVGADLGGLRRSVLKELQSYGINIITNAKVKEISSDRVEVEKSEKTIMIEAKYVIVAAGYISNSKELVDWLDSNEYLYSVIGSAKKPGTIGTATSDAYSIVK